MTASQIKAAYYDHPDAAHRHFFDRATMRWFGDRMTSFGARTIAGQIYLYRKASARVNVFGTWKTAGRTFFNAWRFDPADHDLHICDEQTTDMVFKHIYAPSGQVRRTGIKV